MANRNIFKPKPSLWGNPKRTAGNFQYWAFEVLERISLIGQDIRKRCEYPKIGSLERQIAQGKITRSDAEIVFLKACKGK